MAERERDQGEIHRAKSREYVGLVAIAAGVIILGIKIVAAVVTHSQAIFSDALESTVNVLAALVAYILIRISNRPADDNHPYGHGKTEHFSASFEGGLVSLAALIVMVRACWALLSGHSPQELSSGLILATVATAGNFVLGRYLIHRGRSLQSAALVASGHHALSDFWTTAAALVGLAIVVLTGITAIDAVVAIGMGLYLAFIGYRIVRRALGALLDEEDVALLQDLVKACNAVHSPGIIQVHNARMMRSGTYHFIDAHVVVPEFWDVLQAHDTVNEFERRLIDAHSHQGEVHFHIDPCRRAFCAECDYPECPVRKHVFVKSRRYTVRDITAAKPHAIGAQGDRSSEGE